MESRNQKAVIEWGKQLLK